MVLVARPGPNLEDMAHLKLGANCESLLHFKPTAIPIEIPSTYRLLEKKAAKRKGRSDRSQMDGVGGAGEVERGGIDSKTQVLRDKFRLSAISIAKVEAGRNGMDASEVVVASIADLAFKYAEQLAKDVELFAQHANRKSVNMEDVILSAHRNEHLSTLLRTFSIDLKTKEPQSERKRKKATKKEDQATT